jgi:hypothetical protein
VTETAPNYTDRNVVRLARLQRDPMLHNEEP